MAMNVRPAALAVTCSLVFAAAPPVPAQVHFEISCDASIQDEFDRAVTLLHSFEYPETTRLFGELAERNPACAMAHWGRAMSIWHPLWAPPGEAELAAGQAILARTDELPMADREARYIDALRSYFSSTDTKTHRERARAYEARMAALHSDYLDDPEAAVFYALSLLATADPRDKSYAQQYKAAALLNWVRIEQPTHPGVLHYLIHSYDFPPLAHLALDAAKTYAAAAPDSAHAQHMPSHIFTRLGLWDMSLASNHDSTRSAELYTKRAKLPGHYDEGLHSIDYLMYAMLQTARDSEARDLLARLGRITRTDTENFKVAYTYAAAPARFALERRAWTEASRLELMRADFPWHEFDWARSIHHFARGIGAARSAQISEARRQLAEIEAIRARLAVETLPYWREEVQVHHDAVSSWILYAEGYVDDAIELARAAAEREDAVDKHPVTPGEVLPARELFADLLYEAGRHADALAEYEAVLDSSPNRLNAMLGAARSAEKSGHADLARRYADRIGRQVRDGSPDRPAMSLPGD